jgi:hypothetical protein
LRRVAAAVAIALLTGCSPGTGSPPAHKTPQPTRSVTSAAPPTPARLRVSRTAWRLPVPLAREAVVPRSPSTVLVAGGLLSGDRSSASTYTLNLRDGSVAHLPDLATEVHDTAGLGVDGHVLVVGGGNAAEQGTVQAALGHRWRVVGSLPTPRSDLTAVRVGTRSFVVGGYDGTSAALGDVLTSRRGRHWTVAGSLPVPVRYPATVAAHGFIWVFGGERAGAMVDTVQRIDPRSGTVRVVAHLPTPLGHSAVVDLGGRLLIVGGRTSVDKATSRMWWFRPGGGFTPAGRLPTPLADTAVVSQDARTAYLIGGETPALSDRVVRLSYH